MRIGIIADLYAFRHGCGIYTWLKYMAALGRRIGFKYDILIPCPEERFKRRADIYTVAKDLEAMGYGLWFSYGDNHIEAQRNIFENYLNNVTDCKLLLSCNSEDFRHGPWDTKGVKLMTYQHTGSHAHHYPSIIQEAHMRQPNLGNICITNRSKELIEAEGFEAVHLLQPFYPDELPPANPQGHGIIISGGYIYKRDDLSIQLCKQFDLPFKGFGYHNDFELIRTEQVVYEMAKAKFVSHMSMSEMLPYILYEAASYCNVIVDKRCLWVRGVMELDIGLSVIGINPDNPEEFKAAVEQPFESKFDLESYHDRTETVWREFLRSL